MFTEKSNIIADDIPCSPATITPNVCSEKRVCCKIKTFEKATLSY